MRRLTQVATPVAHLVGPGRMEAVNGRLAFRAESDTGGPLRLEAETLEVVCCYGAVSISDEAMLLLWQHDVDVAFLTPSGTRCRGRLVRPDSPRTNLRRIQHRVLADSQRQRQLACWVVQAKVESQRVAARHYQRQGASEAGAVLAQLDEVLARLPEAELDVLRGLEGMAAVAWFGLQGTLLGEAWPFTKRVRRPPTDPVNALLSLGYTWVLNRVVARVESAGLESYLGALHDYRAGRPSLACDLMEPLRVPGVDRWVVALCNQGQVGAGDFQEVEGGIHLREGRFGRILSLWEQHWVRTKQDAEMDRLVRELSLWLRECGGEGLVAAADEFADL